VPPTTVFATGDDEGRHYGLQLTWGTGPDRTLMKFANSSDTDKIASFGRAVATEMQATFRTLPSFRANQKV
jgi:hypothetical protein